MLQNCRQILLYQFNCLFEMYTILHLKFNQNNNLLHGNDTIYCTTVSRNCFLFRIFATQIFNLSLIIYYFHRFFPGSIRESFALYVKRPYLPNVCLQRLLYLGYF